MERQITDFEYFINKKTNTIYLSKSLPSKQPIKNEDGEIIMTNRPVRIASIKLKTEETHKFIKKGKEIALRITPGGNQEIKAKFFEDTKGMFVLTIQKFTTETGSPHNTYFSFLGYEIQTLVNFITNVTSLPIVDNNKAKFDIKAIEKVRVSKEQVLEFLSKNPELIDEIITSNITKEEIINLSYRKLQIEIFNKLLTNEDFFNNSSYAKI